MARRLRFQTICPNGETVHVKDTCLAGHYRTSRHTHDFHELFLVTSGTIRHHVNGTSIDLCEGCLCLIEPSDEHCFQAHPSCERSVFTNVAFPSRFIEQASTALPLAPRRTRTQSPLMLSPLTGVGRLCFDQSLTVLSAQDATSLRHGITLTRLLVTLLAEVSLQGLPCGYRDTAEAPGWLTSAMRLMETPENAARGLQRFISLAGKSQEHLTRQMRTHFGITPTGFVNNLRLDVAANLLRDTDRAVLPIALQAGFGSMSHFLTLFRRRYGCAPRDYRRRHRQVTDPVELNRRPHRRHAR